jgi:hypothetical protein
MLITFRHLGNGAIMDECHRITDLKRMTVRLIDVSLSPDTKVKKEMASGMRLKLPNILFLESGKLKGLEDNHFIFMNIRHTTTIFIVRIASKESFISYADTGKLDDCNAHICNILSCLEI